MWHTFRQPGDARMIKQTNPVSTDVTDAVLRSTAGAVSGWSHAIVMGSAVCGISHRTPTGAAYCALLSAVGCLQVMCVLHGLVAGRQCSRRGDSADAIMCLIQLMR